MMADPYEEMAAKIASRWQEIGWLHDNEAAGLKNDIIVALRQSAERERHSIELMLESIGHQAMTDWREEIMRGTGAVSINAAKYSARSSAIADALATIRARGKGE